MWGACSGERRSHGAVLIHEGSVHCQDTPGAFRHEHVGRCSVKTHRAVFPSRHMGGRCSPDHGAAFSLQDTWGSVCQRHAHGMAFKPRTHRTRSVKTHAGRYSEHMGRYSVRTYLWDSVIRNKDAWRSVSHILEQRSVKTHGTLFCLRHTGRRSVKTKWGSVLMFKTHGVWGDGKTLGRRSSKTHLVALSSHMEQGSVPKHGAVILSKTHWAAFTSQTHVGAVFWRERPARHYSRRICWR
ncbi:hypothetical protein AVEN_4458-1 [Araneus ventricosus]|uniref:Uncharacterized protein n=1 Tax=Araneus ventricosus TaxID=182803 RepID=A0A4Y2TPI6_ARAVE|nr:hypothetical protein AVEN_4458-1 [Araneus ventricosus]